MKNTPCLDILVIEDNAGDFVLLRHSLEQAAVAFRSITHAETIADAIEQLEQKEAGLIFLDLHLPDSDGLESFEEVNKVATDVPIIVLSGMTNTDLALQAISMGAQDYLLKGDFDTKMLSKSIEYSVERKRLVKELLQEQQGREQEVTAAAIAAQEKERDQIGKELHDNVNQILATGKMYVEYAMHNEEDRDSSLQRSIELIAMSIQEIRNLSKSLIQPFEGMVSLQEAIEELAATMEQLQHKTIRFAADDFNEERLDNALKLTVYRIVQEQLTNIFKHAAASVIDIKLESTDHELLLVVADNGKGFDRAARRKGVGITNIINRARLHHGEVTIETAPGKGCTLSIHFAIK